MEDMAEDFGWDLDDFWEEEVLTPEEQLASDRAQAQVAHEEMLGEMYASQFAFD
jgi:KaiC/GvpD/RAD55 family RecA-like ATPase